MIETQKTIAIIGASVGQKILYQKAKDMGLRVVGFAWNKGVISDGMYDMFFEISVTDVDAIVEKCKELKVDGVVTNASDFLMPLTSMIAEKLGLNCTPSNVIAAIQNKEIVRELTSNIDGLSSPMFSLFSLGQGFIFPCVVKPVKGAAKRGVSYCEKKSDLAEAIKYAGNDGEDILVEEYVMGREFSVESLSFNGKHNIVQITDKENSGPPHFVELAHHQPSIMTEKNKEHVKQCVKKILDRVGFKNGATHIEMKLNEATGRLYLIEINCRGGGDHISDTLVNLSTDCDFIEEIINIAMNTYISRKYKNTSFAGICYLTSQNKKVLRYFSEPYPDWIIHSERSNAELTESTSNYNRDGFFIYQANLKPNI